MLDAYIPKGAFDDAVEKQLLAQLTDILLKWEGADPSNEAARALAWVFLHRPEVIYKAGSPTDVPHYRIVVSVPEGQLNKERREGMVAAVTKAVLDAEPSERERDPDRVWVFTSQVPEGTWGGGGRIVGLADIATKVSGDPVIGKAHAKKRLAAAKAEREAAYE